MTVFNVGDLVEADLESLLNKDKLLLKLSYSTRAIVEHLKDHPNIFTVIKVEQDEKPCIVCLREISGGFLANRFKLIKTAHIDMTEEDLEVLLNG